MRFLWSTIRKDWLRYSRDPAEFALWLGIPLLIGALIILAFGGRGGPQPQSQLLVADEDDSFLSGLLVGALSQEAEGGLIRAVEVTRQEGRKRLDAGKASALLVIPEGFATAALREKPTGLQLLTNPAQRVMPGIVEETLSMAVDASFYLHRLLGDELRALADGPPEGRHTFLDGFIADFSVRLNRVIERLATYLDPVVVTLETGTGEDTEDAEEESGTDSLGLLFVPSILFMALLFMAQSLSGDLWRERTLFTLRRVVVSPRRVSVFLAGKLLASLGMILVTSVVALSVGYAYFRLSPWTLPLAVAWSASAGCMLLAAMTLLQVHAPSQRGANVISIALVFPLMMLGGSFFPFEAMPDWMAGIGRFTPNGWALLQLKEIIRSEFDLAVVAGRFLALVAVTGLMFWLSVLRLRRGFAQG